MKRKWLLIVVLLLGLFLMSCSSKEEEKTEPKEEVETEAPVEETKGDIILSTTTSTQDSGLLDAILPDFTEKTGIGVKVVAVGTGAALANGQEGNADVVLVHAKASEEEFVANGYGVERFDVMYNDFVLVGPETDPAKVKEQYGKDIEGALKAIASTQSEFISRGDDSGTHKKELALWKNAEVLPEGVWYVEAGAGMGDVLTMANEKKAYTLTDRATYLSMKDKLDLIILVEGSEDLMNQYGVIAVNPSISEKINEAGADAFIKWILSEETQKMIGEYGVAEYGEPLFFPNAK